MRRREVRLSASRLVHASGEIGPSRAIAGRLSPRTGERRQGAAPSRTSAAWARPRADLSPWQARAGLLVNGHPIPSSRHPKTDRKRL